MAAAVVDYENWMTHLPETARNIPLNELAIPGSHNSFSYCLDASLAVAPDLDKSISTAVNALSSIFPAAQGAVLNWSKNQKLTLLEQLKAGIRYFDCRVGLHEESGCVRFMHGLWARAVAEELSQLAQFLSLHPGEIVFLDFNHMYCLTDDDHVAFAAELISLLGDFLIPFNEYANGESVNWQDLTLAKLAGSSKRRQVVVFYANDTGVALSDLAFWPQSTIEAPWPRTCDPTAMIRFHEERLAVRQQQGSANNNLAQQKFYVWQGIVTPDGAFIMRNLTKNFYENAVTQATSSFVQWLTSKKASPSNGGRLLCSAFIADGVEISNFISTVLSFNFSQ